MYIQVFITAVKQAFYSSACTTDIILIIYSGISYQYWIINIRLFYGIYVSYNTVYKKQTFTYLMISFCIQIQQYKINIT